MNQGFGDSHGPSASAFLIQVPRILQVLRKGANKRSPGFTTPVGVTRTTTAIIDCDTRWEHRERGPRGKVGRVYRAHVTE